MRTTLRAGTVSLVGNLLIWYAFIPLPVASQLTIIFQIAFWTFFAAVGATVTMIVLQRLAASPIRIFVLLALIVFLLSLILIYLHMGILHDLPPDLLGKAVRAISAMHIIDSFIVSGFVISKYSGGNGVRYHFPLHKEFTQSALE